MWCASSCIMIAANAWRDDWKQGPTHDASFNTHLGIHLFFPKKRKYIFALSPSGLAINFVHRVRPFLLRWDFAYTQSACPPSILAYSRRLKHTVCGENRVSVVFIHSSYVVHILLFSFLGTQMSSEPEVWTNRISTPCTVFLDTVVHYKS